MKPSNKYEDEFNSLYKGKFGYLFFDGKYIHYKCNIHGELKKTPYHLLNDRMGCKFCNFDRRSRLQSMNNIGFLDKVKEKALINDYDDYSLVEYVRSNKKIKVICHKKDDNDNEHGVYEITPNSYLMGARCKKCANELHRISGRLTQEEFISRLKKSYVNKPWYDLSQVEYCGGKRKINVFCHKKDKNGIEHGLFQVIAEHAVNRGDGCRKCKYESVARKERFTTESFIEAARKVHGNKWDYSKTVYVSYNEPCTIICPIHGDFLQTPDSHLQGSGCQVCSHRKSSQESEIYEYIKYELGFKDTETRRRGIISSMKEIDIYIPSKRIGIEYDGCRWHTEKFGKDKFYHLGKTLSCKRNGISLIHVFEDEYKLKKDVVLSKISHRLGMDISKPKIYGRKTCIKELTKDTAFDFINENSLQEPSGNYFIGAYSNGELIGTMSFSMEGKEWLIENIASSIKFVCCGVIGKLLYYFINHYSPNTVKVFADRRWVTSSDDNLYTRLGFTLSREIEPSSKYVIDGGYVRNNDYAEKSHRIWDCGQFEYVLKCQGN